jgi:hypothetical protein
MHTSVSDQGLRRIAVARRLLTIGITVCGVVGATIAPASVGVWPRPSEPMANR